MLLVFVCTANIARSPYAERRFAQLLGPDPAVRGAVEVVSAGIPGFEGRAMDDEMAAVLRRHEASGEGHVSHALTGEVMAAADLVLSMEFAQHMRIFDFWPQHQAKTRGLAQFAQGASNLVQLRAEARRMAWPDTVSGLVEAAAALAPPDSESFDVDDPHRRGPAAAARCAAVIDGHLQQILPLFTASG